jgi:hypothetical protein
MKILNDLQQSLANGTPETPWRFSRSPRRLDLELGVCTLQKRSIALELVIRACPINVESQKVFLRSVLRAGPLHSCAFCTVPLICGLGRYDVPNMDKTSVLTQPSFLALQPRKWSIPTSALLRLKKPSSPHRVIRVGSN